MGALTSALTYSGSAAIHACLLVWRGPANGELDIYALGAILSTSCIITVPLINWSTTLRQLGSRDDQQPGARTIVIYWGGLVLVGFITILTTIWNPEISNYCLSNVNPIGCSPTSSQISYEAGQDPGNTFIVDLEWIQTNGCMDPCQLQGEAQFPWEPAIFRSYSDLQLVSRAALYDVDIFLPEIGGKKEQQNAKFAFISAYFFFGTIAVSFLLSQGVWALVFNRQTPRQSRRTIYQFILNLPSMSQTVSSSVENSRRRRRQKLVAKWLATIAYLWAVVASILSIILFIGNIVIMELLLTAFPQSESLAHVGAWSPWSNTGLVIVAACIGQFHASIVQLITWPIRRCLGNPRRTQEVPHFGADANNGGKESKSISDHISGKTRCILQDNLLVARHTLKRERDSLTVFWRDPDKAVEEELQDNKHPSRLTL